MEVLDTQGRGWHYKPTRMKSPLNFFFARDATAALAGGLTFVALAGAAFLVSILAILTSLALAGLSANP